MAPIGLTTFKYHAVANPEDFPPEYAAEDDNDLESSLSRAEIGLSDGPEHEVAIAKRKRIKVVVLGLGLVLVFFVTLVGAVHVLRSWPEATRPAKPDAVEAGTEANAPLSDPETTTAAESTAESQSQTPPGWSWMDKPFRLHFHGETAMNEAKPIPPSECPVRVEYTTQEDKADAVVWNSNSYDGFEDQAERDKLNIERPWQKHVMCGAPHSMIMLYMTTTRSC